MTAPSDLAFARRLPPAEAVAEEAPLIAGAAHEMAARFRAGGRLLAFGTGAGAADAAHLAVEFVHPAVVGARALPAISLVNDGAALTAVTRAHGHGQAFAAQLRMLGRPGDIAVGIGPSPLCRSVRRGLAEAVSGGLLTVALTGTTEPVLPGVRHWFAARTDDPRIAKEIHVTVYHILWELVQVFLDQPAPHSSAREAVR
ncbi:SIS domain-containing protein [Plantactinospora endophytica]|uniref:Phosphoheptose isomerase n=1 Tax=Plantactinospora endophytica TaxID=673535 RepID=A0ABQ4DZV7_9ACTN|nr:SIS domain-containing protein [Plantactinospora endophytica]GIG87984.1 phosphoheptose isomerase [Plantactinospora endophytica]